VDTAVTVEEDSPQWDCRRDGNRICGEGAVLPDGSLAVPGDYTQPELLARCDLLRPPEAPERLTVGVLVDDTHDQQRDGPPAYKGLTPAFINVDLPSLAGWPGKHVEINHLSSPGSPQLDTMWRW
jgi:hypothetical protein